MEKRKPNLVITSGYQICWKKFCVYWDIELRTVPMDENCLSMDPEKVLDYVDDYTIGVVGLLGITYTGKFDDIKGLDEKLEQYNAQHDIKVPSYRCGFWRLIYAFCKSRTRVGF